MNCGVDCRRGSDPALLWLRPRPEATAPIRPLAWKPPYAMGAALEKVKRPKKKKKERFDCYVFQHVPPWVYPVWDFSLPELV